MDSWPTTFPSKVRINRDITAFNGRHDLAGTDVWVHEVGNLGYAYRYTLTSEDNASTISGTQLWGVVRLDDIEKIAEFAPDTYAMVMFDHPTACDRADNDHTVGGHLAGDVVKLDHLSTGSKPYQWLTNPVTGVITTASYGTDWYIHESWLKALTNSEADYFINEWIERDAKPVVVVPEVDEKDELIKRLRDTVARSAAAHQKDIELIGAELNTQAEERGWCGDFDSIVRRLNSDLSVPLPLREHEYDVEIVQEYTVKITRTTRVTASSAEDAEELASEEMDQLDDRELYDHITNEGSVDAYYQDSNVENVEEV